MLTSDKYDSTSIADIASNLLVGEDYFNHCLDAILSEMSDGKIRIRFGTNQDKKISIEIDGIPTIDLFRATDAGFERCV